MSFLMQLIYYLPTICEERCTLNYSLQRLCSTSPYSTVVAWTLLSTYCKILRTILITPNGKEAVSHGQASKVDIIYTCRFAASLIMTMTYGKTTPTYYTDPEVSEINIHTTRLGKVVPAGQHVVDNYPILRHVPFVASTLRRWHEEELSLFSTMVDLVRTQVVGALEIVAIYIADLMPYREKTVPNRHSQRICWNIKPSMVCRMTNWHTLQARCLGLVRTR